MELRKIEIEDLHQVDQIITDAIMRLKENKINQWQNGYPNIKVIKEDIERNQAYGLYDDGELIAYAAVVSGEDPFYNDISAGQWQSSQDYIAIHRVAIKGSQLGLGMGSLILKLIESDFNQYMRVDTGLDNIAMQKLLNKAGFHYCGTVQVADGLRMAFDKIPFMDDLC